MSRRRVQLVILCEDRQHSAFARRFAEASGWEKRQIQVILSPKGRGCGEQWVREQYASEVGKLRAAPHVARALAAVIDEDAHGAGCRDAQFAEALEQAGLPPRRADEPVLHVIPARNIETWLAYLRGVEVDETKTYPRLAQERDCRPMVGTLKTMRDAGRLRKPAPRSLVRACKEYRTRLP
jgi:hypothetical protein